MVGSREAALAFPKGDLELVFCHDCGFIQNWLFDPTLERYSPDYEETQAFSPRFRRFLEEIVSDHAARYSLAGRTVLEIGCGKGEFLVLLCERTGALGIGIDPGVRPERLSSPALERITFIRDFYRPEHAQIAADYICCRHTLEHIQPVQEFVSLVRQAIGERTDTIVFFELPDMERVLRQRAFWDIYYEHCSYFTASSLAGLFRRCGFEILRLYRAYDDQYLMLEARPRRSRAEPMATADATEIVRVEALVRAFANGVRETLAGLNTQIRSWHAAGRRVVLWGSGSKAVSLLTTLDLGEEVQAVVDINPHKWGRWLAGSGHAIVAPAQLRALQPDVVVVVNAIYRDEVAAELAALGLAPELVTLP
jgi:SAM-dependent methyltransferase